MTGIVEYILTIVVAFLITVFLGKYVIQYMIKLKMRQTERIEGVESHLKKQGTPTMGGIMMIISFNLVMIFWIIFKCREMIPVLILADGFAIIGFIDDYLKVILKRSDGFKPKQKLLAQILVTAVFAWYLHTFMPYLLYKVKIPFLSGAFNIGYFAVPLLFCAVLGTVNAVNFTDGVDALASSVTLAVSIFFAVAAFGLHSHTTFVSATLQGALLGFLVYNRHPAKIFMGDTGSLFLGGLVVAMAYMMRLVLFIPIIGLVYLVEIISVVMQVTYFKLTKGKRIFKMTPIHHHFELSGWSEEKIVSIFTLLTFILGIISIMAL